MGAVSAFEQLAKDIASDRPDDKPTEHVADTLLHLGSDREVILSGCHEPVENGADSPPMPAKTCALFFMITPSPKGNTSLTARLESAVIILEAMLPTRTSSRAALKTYDDLRVDVAHQASLRRPGWI